MGAGPGSSYLPSPNLFTDLISHQGELQMMIEKFTQPLDHYNTTLKFTPPRWVNKDLWEAYGVKFGGYASMLPTFDLSNAEG